MANRTPSAGVCTISAAELAICATPVILEFCDMRSLAVLARCCRLLRDPSCARIRARLAIKPVTCWFNGRVVEPKETKTTFSTIRQCITCECSFVTDVPFVPSDWIYLKFGCMKYQWAIFEKLNVDSRVESDSDHPNPKQVSRTWTETWHDQHGSTLRIDAYSLSATAELQSRVLCTRMHVKLTYYPVPRYRHLLRMWLNTAMPYMVITAMVWPFPGRWELTLLLRAAVITGVFGVFGFIDPGQNSLTRTRASLDTIKKMYH